MRGKLGTFVWINTEIVVDQIRSFFQPFILKVFIKTQGYMCVGILFVGQQRGRSSLCISGSRTGLVEVRSFMYMHQMVACTSNDNMTGHFRGPLYLFFLSFHPPLRNSHAGFQFMPMALNPCEIVA